MTGDFSTYFAIIRLCGAVLSSLMFNERRSNAEMHSLFHSGYKERKYQMPIQMFSHVTFVSTAGKM